MTTNNNPLAIRPRGFAFGPSDPNRLRVVEALTLDCQSVSAIIEATELSQPLVSYHLRILSEHGLARAERRGAYTFY